MICWDLVGIIHHKLLERTQTVNTKLYVQQMERLNPAIQEKSPNRQNGVFALHGNARLHITNMSKEAIQTHGWKVLPHSPHSSGLAPVDFHSFNLFQMLCAEFRSILMQNWEFGWMNFSSRNEMISTNEVLKILLSVGKKL